LDPAAPFVEAVMPAVLDVVVPTTATDGELAPPHPDASDTTPATAPTTNVQRALGVGNLWSEPRLSKSALTSL
jgi:hypothetical protein